VIKSRKMSWAEHVAYIQKGRDNLRDLGVDGRIILKWSLKKQIVKVWTEFNLAHDWVQWCALVNIVMSVWSPKKGEKFLD